MTGARGDAGAGEQVAAGALPSFMIIAGTWILIGAMILAGRLIWEQTMWSWEQGPQMVGFSLAHGYAADLFYAYILLPVWTGIAFCWLGLNAIRRLRPDVLSWALVGASLVTILAMHIPENFWQRLFVSRLARRPNAAEFMAEAAAQGDLATVRAFLSHGVQVNAQEPSDGKTALAAAATGCQPAVARYLVEQGADVNLVNASGDSPLAEATAAYCHDVIALLRSRGAALIRGTAAQHDAQVDRELRVSDTDRGRRTDPDSVGIAPR